MYKSFIFKHCFVTEQSHNTITSQKEETYYGTASVFECTKCKNHTISVQKENTFFICSEVSVIL